MLSVGNLKTHLFQQELAQQGFVVDGKLILLRQVWPFMLRFIVYACVYSQTVILSDHSECR
jgi:hypothetical protein